MNELLFELVKAIARFRYGDRWLMVANDGRYVILFGKVLPEALEQWWDIVPDQDMHATPDEAAREAIRLEMLPEMWTQRRAATTSDTEAVVNFV